MKQCSGWWTVQVLPSVRSLTFRVSRQLRPSSVATGASLSSSRHNQKNSNILCLCRSSCCRFGNTWKYFIFCIIQQTFVFSVSYLYTSCLCTQIVQMYLILKLFIKNISTELSLILMTEKFSGLKIRSVQLVWWWSCSCSFYLTSYSTSPTLDSGRPDAVLVPAHVQQIRHGEVQAALTLTLSEATCCMLGYLDIRSLFPAQLGSLQHAVKSPTMYLNIRKLNPQLWDIWDSVELGYFKHTVIPCWWDHGWLSGTSSSHCVLTVCNIWLGSQVTWNLPHIQHTYSFFFCCCESSAAWWVEDMRTN